MFAEIVQGRLFRLYRYLKIVRSAYFYCLSVISDYIYLKYYYAIPMALSKQYSNSFVYVSIYYYALGGTMKFFH